MNRKKIFQFLVGLVVAMICVWVAVAVSGCTPTPFVAGRVVGTPAGCIEARENGSEC